MAQTESEREWPYAPEAEEAVLGSILVDGDTLDEVIDIIDKDDFKVQAFIFDVQNAFDTGLDGWFLIKAGNHDRKTNGLRLER